MNTLETLESFKQRPLKMAAEPVFRFKNTERKVAQNCMERRTNFEGYSAQEIDQAEAELRLRLPEVFRMYLLFMGKRCTDLFEGSDLAGPHQLNGFRRRAQELMGVALTLPADAVVFLAHQGYQFAYIRATGGEDSPV